MSDSPFGPIAGPIVEQCVYKAPSPLNIALACILMIGAVVAFTPQVRIFTPQPLESKFLHLKLDAQFSRFSCLKCVLDSVIYPTLCGSKNLYFRTTNLCAS
jgi:hypothetical protein